MQPDLSEIEPEGLFEHRVDRGQQGLHEVVQEMAEAHRRQDRKDRSLGSDP